ncbi:hypothetical protein [Streptomyces sp. CL12-4]|uniref:hypothetical protein n=1 Tax=Streptomyces sp. CL12-4 TaxID=2810306 RepID=UPI001EFB7ABF|nr:hypothetical protein [Streptomyces sp. CL12-4]MCG8969108.1 hypothetical protein [Streptomyces sp. CL12-4]
MDPNSGPDVGNGPGPDAVIYPMIQPTPEERDAAFWAEVTQRKQRALELVTPARPADGAGDDEPTLSYNEFRALCEAPDVQQKAADIEAAAGSVRNRPGQPSPRPGCTVRQQPAPAIRAEPAPHTTPSRARRHRRRPRRACARRGGSRAAGDADDGWS